MKELIVVGICAMVLAAIFWRNRGPIGSGLKSFAREFVQNTKKKEVRGWIELEAIRAQYAPVLGLDGAWVTLKWNMAYFFSCVVFSKAFFWCICALAMLGVALRLEVHYGWSMSDKAGWFFYGNAGLALLHLAAKDEFREVMLALARRLCGELGFPPPGIVPLSGGDTQPAPAAVAETGKK